MFTFNRATYFMFHATFFSTKPIHDKLIVSNLFREGTSNFDTIYFKCKWNKIFFFLRQRRVISQEVLLELLNSFDAIDPAQTFYQFHHLGLSLVEQQKLSFQHCWNTFAALL